MRFFRGFLLCLGVLGGCSRAPTMPVHQPGAAVPDDSVVMVGLAGFEPELQPGKPPSADPEGRESHLMLGFSYTADIPIDVHSVSGGPEEWALVTPGKPFAIRAPKRAMFLRVMSMFIGNNFTGRAAANPDQGEVKPGWITCSGVKYIEPKPEDRVIYIGTFRCNHDNGVPFRITTNYTMDTLKPMLPSVVGSAPVTVRLADDMK